MELLDVYNNNGERTGRIVERGAKDISFTDGEHIAVAIIYIENDNNEFLIQKTSKQKGGNYSSTGGHVNHNEEPIDTIKREVKEELGIDISKDNIVDLGYLLFDFPIRFVFYLRKNIDIKDIILQKEEVESVSYMSEDKLRDLIEKGLMHEAHAKVLEYVLEYKKRSN
jgi:8-oxo-dGTP pyrophosphatase MutT (NUDIX family)